MKDCLGFKTTRIARLGLRELDFFFFFARLIFVRTRIAKKKFGLGLRKKSSD